MTHDFNDGNGEVLAHQHLNSNGTLGGWVANTAYVAPTCYTGPNTKVYGYPYISEHANIFSNSQISGNPIISGNAQFFGNSKISGNAHIYGHAEIYGYTEISGNAVISGDAIISGGIWEVSPLYIQGSRYSCYNSKPGYIKIGCKELTFAEWLDDYKIIGKENNFTELEIEEYKKYIDLIIELGK